MRWFDGILLQITRYYFIWRCLYYFCIINVCKTALKSFSITCLYGSLPQQNDNSLFNAWIINIWNITNMKKKFLSNSSFQDLMVLCCRKWWKRSWWYRYFPIVLNIFNLAKTGNIKGFSCMWECDTRTP